jgi:hypothetical protein
VTDRHEGVAMMSRTKTTLLVRGVECEVEYENDAEAESQIDWNFIGDDGFDHLTDREVFDIEYALIGLNESND